VIFRVTQSEYDLLKDASIEAGASSLSAYTRSEILMSLANGASGMTVPERFDVIDRKLGSLQVTLTRVVNLLTSPLGEPPHPSPARHPADD
jgi:hypothetical protein